MPPLGTGLRDRFRRADAGARNLVLLVGAVAAALLGYYAFLAWRAHLWSPHWAVTATTAPAERP